MNVSDELRQLAESYRAMATSGCILAPADLAGAALHMERLATGARRMEQALDQIVADAMEEEHLWLERRAMCTGNVIPGPWLPVRAVDTLPSEAAI